MEDIQELLKKSRSEVADLTERNANLLQNERRLLSSKVSPVVSTTQLAVERDDLKTSEFATASIVSPSTKSKSTRIDSTSSSAEVIGMIEDSIAIGSSINPSTRGKRKSEQIEVGLSEDSEETLNVGRRRISRSTLKADNMNTSETNFNLLDSSMEIAHKTGSRDTRSLEFTSSEETAEDVSQTKPVNVETRPSKNRIAEAGSKFYIKLLQFYTDESMCKFPEPEKWSVEGLVLKELPRQNFLIKFPVFSDMQVQRKPMYYFRHSYCSFSTPPEEYIVTEEALSRYDSSKLPPKVQDEPSLSDPPQSHSSSLSSSTSSSSFNVDSSTTFNRKLQSPVRSAIAVIEENLKKSSSGKETSLKLSPDLKGDKPIMSTDNVRSARKIIEANLKRARDSGESESQELRNVQEHSLVLSKQSSKSIITVPAPDATSVSTIQAAANRVAARVTHGKNIPEVLTASTTTATSIKAKGLPQSAIPPKPAVPKRSSSITTASTNISTAIPLAPFIEDIDLKDEVISVRNPSATVRDISGWHISDDDRRNKYTFPAETSILPKAKLHVYCCAKNRDMHSLLQPHIFWTNKDGTVRMKNVLNDDGDKISLLQPSNKLVSTCKKVPGGQPIVEKFK